MTVGASPPPVVREGLFGVDPPALLGARCRACGALAFPVVETCAACGAAEPETVRLSTRGTIHSFTIVRVPVPGYEGPLPYGLGIVELEEGIRVSSTLVAEPLERLRIGAAVRLRLIDVGREDAPLLSYAYALESR